LITCTEARRTPEPLLAPDEPPAVEIINAGGSGSAVLLCDHASRRIPRRLGDLGLDPYALRDHIAWDPGAAEVARCLAALLDAPLIASGYSRLIIDCNRPLRSPESVTERSAGVVIPGNRNLIPAERAARVDALFRPYHNAVDDLLDARRDRATALLSIHSFTPILNGGHRPWHAGISHWRDRRLAERLLAALRQHRTLEIGDNLPYPIDDDIDYSVPVHGDGRGLPAVMIEIRQDLIATAAAAAAWAARIADAYRMIDLPD
jgi:predicted N-formylglutamate amidohydrolase